MRIARWIFAPIALVTACSSSADTDATGAPATVGFTYAPLGCGYTVTPIDGRGDEFALDAPVLGAAPTPQRVRIGLGGSVTLGDAAYADPAHTAAIAWDTDVDTRASTLRIGKSPTALDQTHAGYSYLLPGSVPTRVHQAHVCGLEPQTTYYYQVGGGPAGAEAWGPTLTLTTLPAAGAAAEVRLGVAGDSRDSLDVIWPLVQGRMKDAAPSAQVFTGDSIPLALPDSESSYATWLDHAFKLAAPGDLTLGNVPLYPIGGNHENLQAQWLANFAAPGSGTYQGYFWSFDAGAIHALVVDDNAVSANVSDDAQAAILDFLEKDLSAADARRDKTPWLVVFHHRGELSTSNHAGDKDMERMRALLMPVWDKHHVTLVLNGHDHNYERSAPATWSGSAPVVAADAAHGTTYIVCAGAGAGAYGTGDGAEPYSAKRVRFEGSSGYVGVYGLLSATPQKMEWKAYRLKASGSKVADDDEIDTVSWGK